eukprot:351938-Chlamydomonas_euryale.AAC.7
MVAWAVRKGSGCWSSAWSGNSACVRTGVHRVALVCACGRTGVCMVVALVARGLLEQVGARFGCQNMVPTPRMREMGNMGRSTRGRPFAFLTTHLQAVLLQVVAQQASLQQHSIM